MTSPISAVGAIGSIGSASPVRPTTGAASSGSDFASVLNKGLDSLQSTQSKADNLAVQAATGDLTDISQYTIAATQASLATSLASALRTKAVDAFNQVMGMQA